VLLVLVLVGACAGPAADAPADTRRSGFDFMGAATQAMQRDDSQNPGLLWVQEGADLWRRASGAQARSCAACHGSAEVAMRGVAARYPALDEAGTRPITLAQRINQCRQQRQQLPALPHESRQLLALESFVAHQSRGLPVAAPTDPRLQPFVQRGARLYAQRLGQLDLSCSQCHDTRAGLRLGGSPIPQAHPTGYPVYRLEWQGMGSLQRRLRACMAGVRAEPYAYGAPELVDLELFLAVRARGLLVETPAVRP